MSNIKIIIKRTNESCTCVLRLLYRVYYRTVYTRPSVFSHVSRTILQTSYHISVFTSSSHIFRSHLKAFRVSGGSAAFPVFVSRFSAGSELESERGAPGPIRYNSIQPALHCTNHGTWRRPSAVTTPHQHPNSRLYASQQYQEHHAPHQSIA